MKLLTVAIAAVVLTSCTGKQGPVGPAGPGGMDGIDGTNGLNGALNMSSRTITIGANDFTQGTLTEYADYTVTEITADVTDNGTVLAYIKLFDHGNGWTALPLTVPGKDQVSVTYTFAPSLFELVIDRATGEPTSNAFVGSILRIVVIPPGQTASSSDIERLLKS